MPQVIDTVKKRYPFEVRQFDPNQAVAKGAALFGYKCYLDEQIKIRLGGEPDNASRPRSSRPRKKWRRSMAWPWPRSQGDRQQEDHQRHLEELRHGGDESAGPRGGQQPDRDRRSGAEDDRPRNSAPTEEEQIQVDLRCMENKLRGDTRGGYRRLQRAWGRRSSPSPGRCPGARPSRSRSTLGPDGLLTIKGRDLTTGGKIDAQFKTESIMSHEEVEAAKSRNLALQVA